MASNRIVIPADVSAAIKAFQGDARADREHRFIVIGFIDKITLKVAGSGPGGLAEASAFLGDDDASYILVRKSHQVEIALTVKIAFIEWLPELIKPMRKAMLSTFKGQVEDILKPYHVSLHASSKSDLKEEEIMEKIGFSSGTAQHTTVKTNTKVEVTSPPKLAQLNISPPSMPKIAPQMASPAVGRQEEKKLTIQDEAEMRTAIAAVRDDQSDIAWVVIGYADAHTLQLIGKGAGSIEEAAALLQPGRAFYILFRQLEKFDASVRTMFGFVKILSDTLPPMQKAKIATHSGFITKLLEPFHEQILLSDHQELTNALVTAKLQSIMGTKSRVLSGSEVQSTKRPSVHESKGPTAAIAAQLISYENEELFKAGIKSVRSDQNGNNWFAASLSGQTCMQILGSGDGGLTAMLASFQDDAPCFGLLRVSDQIDNSKTTKFVYVKCLPATVPPMRKARLTTLKGAIDAIFQPFHVEFFVEDKAELTDEIVADKVGSFSGSKLNVTDKAASGRLK